MLSTTLRFRSNILGMRVTMDALLPDDGPGPFPTLYLLHGLSDDHTIWGRLTRIESYAWNLPIAIVMPQGFRGFYTNQTDGPQYADYIAKDVVGTAERVLPLKRTRKGRSIAGLSMGGYGAMRIALGFPEMFCAVASHSGVLTQGHDRKGVLHDHELRQIFGSNPIGTDHDLLALAKKVKRKGKLPKIKIDCGTEDFLIEHNRRAHAGLDKLGVPHEYAEYPGIHNWDYWDEHIRETLPWAAKAMGVK
ncbi:MAG: alpha/beta hydrolase family protein [Tepidisphaeraceae bacterium]